MKKITINTDASVTDLMRGWLDDVTSSARVCVFCGERFGLGHVHRFGAELLTSRAAAARHVLDAHGGAFEAITSTGPAALGIGDAQAIVLRGFHDGDDDPAVAAALGGKALSTVRNHRRNLRIKAAEAKLFLAAMALAEEHADSGKRFVDFGPSLPIRDGRSDVTEDEAARIEKTFLRPDGSLVRIPPKEKQKLVVLRRVAERFERGRTYNDAEVRSLLGQVHEDYALLRRYLVDYRFIERDPEGTRYRRP